MHGRGRQRRIYLITALAAISVTVLAGCGGKSGGPATATVTETPTAAKSAVPSPAAPAVWPLTGQAGDIVARPAVTIKIENSVSARPQAGLDQADIVWEEEVEGGITRFAAMFHSQIPQKVEPIRSVRPMDANIAAPTHGLLVFSGGLFADEARSAGLQVLSQDEGAKGFHRDSSRKAPHNLYGNVQDFLDQANADHSAPPDQVFSYARDAAQSPVVTAGTPASTIACDFSEAAKPGWTWDEGSSSWLRNESGKAAVLQSGDQITATNIVILRVTTKNTGYVDPAGSPVPETVLVADGDATVAVGGKTLAGHWSKGSADAPITLTDANGAPITLAPGTTWVELVPVKGSVTVNP